MQTLLGEDSLGAIKKLLYELRSSRSQSRHWGFCVVRIRWRCRTWGRGGRLLFSVFHSISAFCNAGFTLTTNNSRSGSPIEHELLVHNHDPDRYRGLGFPVLSNIGTKLFAGRHSSYSLQAVPPLETRSADKRSLARWRFSGFYLLEQDALFAICLH